MIPEGNVGHCSSNGLNKWCIKGYHKYKESYNIFPADISKLKTHFCELVLFSFYELLFNQMQEGYKM